MIRTVFKIECNVENVRDNSLIFKDNYISYNWSKIYCHCIDSVNNSISEDRSNETLTVHRTVAIRT
jgi:hypothetical protein